MTAMRPVFVALLFVPEIRYGDRIAVSMEW